MNAPQMSNVCRPFDSSKETNATGEYVWVDNSQSILINGQVRKVGCNPALIVLPSGLAYAAIYAGILWRL